MGDEWDVRGRTVVLTGGTTGIGRATVVELARRGARVLFTARDRSVGDEVVAEAVAAGGEVDVAHRELHLDDLGSIREFAGELRDEIDRIDVLIANAAVVLVEHRRTRDGFEMTFGVNHLGHFLLIEELRDLVVRSAPSRIVVVASDAHRWIRGGLDLDDLQTFRGWPGPIAGLRAYARSKLANILHCRELARRLAGTGVTANSVHPGPVRTRLGRDTEKSRVGEAVVWPLAGLFMPGPEKGARTPVWAATAPELAAVTGAYLADERISEPNEAGRDERTAAGLWSLSEELVQPD